MLPHWQRRGKRNNLSDDLIKIMSGTDQKEVPPFMKLFWEEQKKYLSSYNIKNVKDTVTL